ncbi:hypothetical protein JZ751_024417 [Albula glossodonta]|uniref:Transmembrane protein 223 n=1 Tax=Albula glossodonta TaxID=121402 RepID=A0A8T2NG88_9TELE|nr:hypothetical protein JZ751_024417 [Albula glossodonta]
MVVRFLLAGVPGCPYFVNLRCVEVLFRHQGSNPAPLRTTVRTHATKYRSVTHPSAWTSDSQPLPPIISSFSKKRFCAGQRLCTNPTKSSSTDPKRFCSGILNGLFATCTCKHAQKNLCSIVIPSRFHSTNSSYMVAQDVVLFEHDRTRVIQLLSLLYASLVLLWSGLALWFSVSLPDTLPSEATIMMLSPKVWRNVMIVLCLVAGGASAGLGFLYCRQSVGRVILHKGGGKVTLTMQSPWGLDQARRITAPLAQVACHTPPQDSQSFLALQVKDHSFYFRLSKKGTFQNPKLFDITVGAYKPRETEVLHWPRDPWNPKRERKGSSSGENGPAQSWKTLIGESGS